jgi:TonB family protein
VGTGLVQATVHFIIQKDGTVVQPYVMEPSGSSLYDRAALRAVLEAKKFAPLPAEYSGDELGISVVFQTLGDVP